MKNISKISNAPCVISRTAHLWRKKWKNKCLTFPFEIECMHLNELPSDIKILVNDKTPCVVAQINSINKIIIKDEELVHMNGDVDSFFFHILMR